VDGIWVLVINNLPGASQGRIVAAPEVLGQLLLPVVVLQLQSCAAGVLLVRSATTQPTHSADVHQRVEEDVALQRGKALACLAHGGQTALYALLHG
jgi:hypothetical protein